jgi:hypothetical protein
MGAAEAQASLQSRLLCCATDPQIYSRSAPFASYLNVWRERFDYALVLNADVPDAYGPFVPPEGMELVRDEGFAQLYRFARQAR